jgi:Pyruvate/2-oxoacid:ferredoxin oxidoreductase delta subunit
VIKSSWSYLAKIWLYPPIINCITSVHTHTLINITVRISIGTGLLELDGIHLQEKDLAFSQRWRCWLWSSGLWYSNASAFRVVTMKAIRSSETSVTTFKTIWPRHNPEVHNRHTFLCSKCKRNIKYCNDNVFLVLKRIRPSPRPCVTFHNVMVFYCKKLLAPPPAELPSWTTTTCQLSATDYSIYSRLSSMPWRPSPPCQCHNISIED